MLDAFVSDLALKVPLSGDRQAVALIANLFSEVVEPVVAAMDGAHVPGKEEMLSLMRFYCEHSVRADEIGNPARARGNVPLPDHLTIELDYCLAQFSLGQAKTRNGNLQTRFPELIAQITRVPDASAQINAYSKIYYALQTTPRTNPFDSRGFARQLCKDHVLPALRKTVPPTEAVRLVRLRLLEALER
ncbi:MAG: hypothetical protein Q8R63_02480 [Ramlibacter sp.]|nr:hypothetical protein [Ramlibacter sp.]